MKNEPIMARDAELRDLFAMAALIDIRIRRHIAKASGHAVCEESPADKATEAYIIADKMMEARK